MSANGHNAGATASASTSNSRGHKQLPRDTRLVALMLSQYAEAADPGVLAQLTEFAHRYTREVLGDAQVYAEHAHRGSAGGQANNSVQLSMSDVRLAIQAKTEQGMNTPWPKETMQDLANQLNRAPLPPLHEYYGVRLPPPSERLTQLNFDLKNKGRPIPIAPLPDTANYDFSMDASSYMPDSAIGGPSTAGMDMDPTFGADLFGDFSATAFDPAAGGLDHQDSNAMFMQQGSHQGQAAGQGDQSMDQDAPGDEDDAMGEADDGSQQ